MKMKLVLAIVAFVILLVCVISGVIPATSQLPCLESPFYKPWQSEKKDGNTAIEVNINITVVVNINITFV